MSSGFGCWYWLVNCQLLAIIINHCSLQCPRSTILLTKAISDATALFQVEVVRGCTANNILSVDKHVLCRAFCLVLHDESKATFRIPLSHCAYELRLPISPARYFLLLDVFIFICIRVVVSAVVIGLPIKISSSEMLPWGLWRSTVCLLTFTVIPRSHRRWGHSRLRLGLCSHKLLFIGLQKLEMLHHLLQCFHASPCQCIDEISSQTQLPSEPIGSIPTFRHFSQDI
mmetsp:Transcript_71632/g.171222  ORF Transcript_71632/g.171222 Transcript_71632/m.171222 type:complete len:228 (+) Transcript_71632:772-1455(+)